MYRHLAKLVVYRNVEKDGILFNFADICKRFYSGNYDKENLTVEIYTQIHRLLDVATKYGFDRNLWQDYLAYLLATTENPFSMACEKIGAKDGSVNQFAKGDFRIFKELYHYDFSPIEKELGINCFTIISDYRAIKKEKRKYNRNVSEKVRSLSEAIREAGDEDEVFRIVTDFYRDHGVGNFGLNKAFRIRIGEGEQGLELEPITNTEDVRLHDLVGYELQKKELVENTEAFLQGRRANNLLLFGDSGTGKSTSVKAILNQYYENGLRVIEIYKHQFKELSNIISMIKNRNYRFIIYMDDLSFEEFEIEYKYLKAVIEGGMEITPENVLIYATSNRRHLIRETWSDRKDLVIEEDIHRSDTMEEKLSLVNRFGITIYYSKPSNTEYMDIVRELAGRYPEINLSEQELSDEAKRWAMWHGGISGRTAQQFINHLVGTAGKR